MVTKFDINNHNTVLVYKNNYENMIAPTNKKKLPGTFFNILIKIDNKVPSQSQSLFDNYVINTVWDHVCASRYDAISKTKPVETISIDSNFAKSANPTVDTVVIVQI